MCALSALRQSRARLSKNKHHKQTRIYINIYIICARGGYLWRAVSRAAPRSDSARRALSKSNTWKGAGKMLFKCPEHRQGGSFPCMRTSSASIKSARWHTQVVFFRRFPQPHSAKLDSRRLEKGFMQMRASRTNRGLQRALGLYTHTLEREECFAPEMRCCAPNYRVCWCPYDAMPPEYK